nr:MAG TPA: hypothetical protein [Caudoviricetes sp.]
MNSLMPTKNGITPGVNYLPVMPFSMYPKPTPTAAQKRMAVPRKPYPKKKLSECPHSPIFSEQMCPSFRLL